MVLPVGYQSNSPNFKSNVTDIKNNAKQSTLFNYTETFVRHSAEALPSLAVIDIFWSFIDKCNGVPFKKALANNTRKVLLPVLLVTSAITTIIERVNSKNQKID